MKRVLFVLIIFMGFGLVSYAQNYDKAAIDKHVSVLQQKVLLDDQQAAQLKSSITKNAANVKPENVDNVINNIKKEFEGSLDAKQKAKYNIIQQSWWAQIKSELVK